MGTRLLQSPHFDSTFNKVVLVPDSSLEGVKIKLCVDNKELLRAYSLGLVDEFYLQLFSPEINSTYQLDVSMLEIAEANFLHYHFLKNKIKENLSILN